MKNAATSSNERNEFRKQPAAEFIGLLRPLQCVSNFGDARLHPPLALALVHLDAIRFHRARHLSNFRALLLIADSCPSPACNQIPQAHVQMKERIDDTPTVKKEQRGHQGECVKKKTGQGLSLIHISEP